MQELLKKALLITSLALALGSTVSCKKCITCTFKGTNSTYNSGEVCDKGSAIDAIKRNCEEQAKTAGVTCTCR
jgi:hypothetical protein